MPTTNEFSHKGAPTLREDINASGKRVVLIVRRPWGDRPGSKDVKDMGIFGDPTGGDQIPRRGPQVDPQVRAGVRVPALAQEALAG